MKHTPITPENTVFAIDLHGVLFTFHKAKLLQLFLSITVCTTLVYCYVNPQIALLFFFLTLMPAAGILVASGYFMLKTGHRPIVEHHLLSSTKPPIPLIKKGWLWISNFYYPRTEFVTICWKLKQAGFSLILLSDIGPEAFDILKKRYRSTFYRNKETLFTATYYPNSPDSTTIQLSPWLPKNAHNFFKKFAQSFIKQNAAIKKIIFIDNNKRNIKHAKKQSSSTFLALRFTNTRQMRTTLIKHLPNLTDL